MYYQPRGWDLKAHIIGKSAMSAGAIPVRVLAVSVKFDPKSEESPLLFSF